MWEETLKNRSENMLILSFSTKLPLVFDGSTLTSLTPSLILLGTQTIGYYANGFGFE